MAGLRAGGVAGECRNDRENGGRIFVFFVSFCILCCNKGGYYIGDSAKRRTNVMLEKKSGQKGELLSAAKPSGQGEESVVVALVVVAGHMNQIFIFSLPPFQHSFPPPPSSSASSSSSPPRPPPSAAPSGWRGRTST